MRITILLLSLWSLPAAQAAQESIKVVTTRVHPSGSGGGNAVTLEMLIKSTCVVIDGIEAKDPHNPRPIFRELTGNCRRIAERLHLTTRLPQTVAENQQVKRLY